MTSRVRDFNRRDFDEQVCPTCHSYGFKPSILGPHRCTFCDGTVGGHPPDISEEV